MGEVLRAPVETLSTPSNAVALAQQAVGEVRAKKSGGAGHKCSHSQKSILHRSVAIGGHHCIGWVNQTRAAPCSDLLSAQTLRLRLRLARLAFLRLVACLPAHAHISKPVALHLLRLIQIAPIDDDREAHGSVQPLQVIAANSFQSVRISTASASFAAS